MKKHRTYAQKLFMTYSAALLALLFVLLAGFLGIGLSGQYKSNAQTQSQLVSKIEGQIDASLQSMDRIVSGLLFNQKFIQIMSDPQAELHYTDYTNQLLDMFIMLDAPSFPSHRIIAFNKTHYYNLSKSGEASEYIRNSLERYPWYEQLESMKGDLLILPVHEDPFEPTSYPVYSVARAVTDGQKTYGVVEVQNDYQQLADLCHLDEGVGTVALFSGEGELLYPRQPEDKALLQEMYDTFCRKNPETQQASFALEGMEVVCSRSAYSGWVTVFYRPLTSVIPYAVQLSVAAVLSFLGLAGISLFMVYLITKRMSAPLVSLSHALNEVSLENLSLELPQCGIEEIETVNRSFQSMFRDLKNAIAASIQSRASEERANYLALQSQMNPHTIYNTIGMIESVSYMNGDMEVSRLCICFSQMLRYISDYSKNEYTVQDELQHLKNYAALTEKRYDGLLCIRAECDEQLYGRCLPKFTLQPLVENAVKHGMRSDGSCLHVDVCIRQEEDGWSVCITDNGCGFDPQKIPDIERQLRHCDDTLKDGKDILNRHIGNLALVNIYMRCRILCGEGFRLELGNREENGAFVKLWFREEDRDETVSGGR